MSLFHRKAKPIGDKILVGVHRLGLYQTSEGPIHITHQDAPWLLSPVMADELEAAGVVWKVRPHDIPATYQNL